MKASCKSLDVFEFREEDELNEVPPRSFASKLRKSHDHEYSFLDPSNRGAEVHTKEIGTAMSGNVDAADVDHSCAAAGSFCPLEIENLDEEKMPGSSNGYHNNFETHEQASELKSNILEPKSVCLVVEHSLTSLASACLTDQSRFPFSESSFDDEFVRLASDADENKTSSDVASSDNCPSGWDLGDDSGGIIFVTDYMCYHGTEYADSVVCFSRSSVEVKSKTICGAKESLRFRLEIDDIVKIESQWSARLQIGIISICFMSKSINLDEAVDNVSESGIHELKFTAVDSDWYEKKEAITSLDVKYKAVWNPLLDIGIEKCSTLPNWEAIFTRSHFPNFDKPFDEVIYPKGDPDAVSISKRDIDLLQPDTFVNDTIIDFYIKYLKRRQNGEERVRFHFFNSFFFRKLADMDKDPSSAFDGKAAFLRVRKWTRKVNLLEKDFIFIPVNYNYHWSLIVICYVGEVAKDTDVDDKLVRVPCILHMDSLRGTHMGLKDLMQSYLWEEWKERQKETCEDLYLKFRNLKFVSLELPQQQNLYDCGLFLLHYVELFLEEAPTNFDVCKITPSSTFVVCPHCFYGNDVMELLGNYIHDCVKVSRELIYTDTNVLQFHMRMNNYILDSIQFLSTSINLYLDILSELQANWFPPGEASMKRACIERLIHELLETSEECSSSESGTSHSPNAPMTANYNENEHEIEMTLLPATPISNIQCTRNIGLGLKNFFEPGYISESFNGVHCPPFEQIESIDELRKPISQTKEEIGAGEHLLHTGLVDPSFQYLDGMVSAATALPYSSREFILGPDREASTEDTSLSPPPSNSNSDVVSEVDADEKCLSFEAVGSYDELDGPKFVLSGNADCSSVHFTSVSGELVGTSESCSLVGDENEGSMLLKNLPEFLETNQIRSSGTSSHETLSCCPPSASGGTTDATEHVCTYRIVNSTRQAYPPTLDVPTSVADNDDGVSLSEACESHAAKRMRVSCPSQPEEITCDLSKDLHL